MNKFLFGALFSFILAGCTNKQLYQMGQGHNKSECMKEAASGEQHDKCMNQEKKTFEEYEKERKELLEKS